VTGEFASAEDAAAEAFRQAWAGLDSLREPERFGAWLRTIVVRQARAEQQRRRADATDLPSGLPDPNERADDALERLEMGALVQQAVRELPDRLREAMALFYFEGYDSDAAARFLDIPPGTLRRRLHEGREQLRSVAEQILKGSKPMNRLRLLLGSPQAPYVRLFPILGYFLAVRAECVEDGADVPALVPDHVLQVEERVVVRAGLAVRQEVEHGLSDRGGAFFEPLTDKLEVLGGDVVVFADLGVQRRRAFEVFGVDFSDPPSSCAVNVTKVLADREFTFAAFRAHKFGGNDAGDVVDDLLLSIPGFKDCF
jgi:RNA polymerase sigma factor (sigma-70 family)